MDASVHREMVEGTISEEDGTVEERTKGTPQGGVISPLLANLFLHYVFDKWMERNYPADSILPLC